MTIDPTTASGHPSAGTNSSPLPRYCVRELNGAIGTLLERGFAPRFLLDATISRPQIKKGHLWLNLLDEAATITGVVWASQLSRLSYRPEDGDGVTVVGRLNFWPARATLCVQILDIRPTLAGVLRQFERVRETLMPTGLLDLERKRPLPEYPRGIALLTSSPSSALADMLRTAAERWPAARILVVPIPVQGPVQATICQRLQAVGAQARRLGVEAVVLARGGGSREDLAVFDSEELARQLASCPVPVITGLGHEDDTTIADLVADYRAATPTGALVALLPDRHKILQDLQGRRAQLERELTWMLERKRGSLDSLRLRLEPCHPRLLLHRRRGQLEQLERLLEALSPQQLLRRGFTLVRSETGSLLRSIHQVSPGQKLLIEWADGSAHGTVSRLVSEASPDP